jgi:hypothetical protein
MNYTRRPNRPDGNVYREMRRQRLRRPGENAPIINPKLVIASAAAAVVVVALWLVWK